MLGAAGVVYMHISYWRNGVGDGEGEKGNHGCVAKQRRSSGFSVPETAKRKAAAMIPGPIRCAAEPGTLMGANGALVYNFCA